MNNDKLLIAAGVACFFLLWFVPRLGFGLPTLSGSSQEYSGRSAQASSSSDKKKVDFAKDIQPIFKAHCYECHSAEKDLASLRLDTKEAAFKGGDSGKVIVPGKSQESLLVQRISGSEAGLRMPPGKPLGDAEIALIRDWIDQGASWPDSATDSKPSSSTQSATSVDFSKDVLPILRENCYVCHSGDRPKGGLHLDNREMALKGGSSGRAIVPGNAGQSRLVRRITGMDGKVQMPLGRQPLTAAQIDIIKSWIDQGARWPLETASEKH
jgi:uncharacterized membrane protein